MSDAFVLATFVIGYVGSGMLVLGITLGSFKPALKLEPVKVRSQRR
ncbi:MAG: hypothetical protein V4760_15955 [Bdellovibrionota bacterium]